MSRNANTRNPTRDPATRDVGPSVRILQINIEGISSAKSDYLQRLLHKMNIDVVNIQETHTKDDSDLERRGHLPGYTLVDAVHHPKYGIATYVRCSLRGVQLVDSSANNLVFTITIQVNDLTVTNVYKPPNVKWPSDVLPSFHHPCAYTGDFNSHHTNWRYHDADENGEALVLWTDLCDLHLLFDAKDRGTFRSARWGKDYNPDLTFVSRDDMDQPLPSTRTVLGNFPNSQHRAIVTEIGLKIPLGNSMPVPRWNFGRANWDGFKSSLDDSIIAANLKPISSNYGRFVRLVIKSAKANIPRGYRKEYIPGWNSESERLYREYQKNEDHSTGATLLKSLNQNRREKWEATVDGMDFKRSSRKAWKVLHRLSGKQHPQKLTPKIKPNAIANRMVEVTRVKRDKMFTKEVKKTLKTDRKITPTGQHLSRPFGVGEVMDGIKLLKRGKAAGPDNVFNEFIRAMGPVSIGWLASLFDYIMINNWLPREFKIAKVIAILKPGKTDDKPENFRPISLLSCTLKLLERLILTRITPYIEAVTPPEQAGFRRGRSCTDQVLSLTTHIESGFQERLKSTAVFIDLTAAYDTVWKQGLMHKILKVIPSREVADVIMNMLSDREFVVHLGGAKSRTRRLNNGLPQGSVLAPTLFNLYIHDLPATESTKFIYADDIALVYQSRVFRTNEEVLSADLEKLNKYFNMWRLIPSPSKTEVACFHLNNRLANYQPIVSFGGEILAHNPFPKYLGVTLDRTLTYKEHLRKVSLKVASRNNILHKLCGTTWGASADCLRTSATALVFSAAEYCAPVWLGSAHVQKVDTQLNEAMRCVSGTIKSTPLQWLPVLSHIAPPHLRRMLALKREADKIYARQSLPIHESFCHPARQRLKSRHPPNVTAKHLCDFDVKQRWKDEWNTKSSGSDLPPMDPTIKPDGFNLPRKLWCRLNRLRTGHGRCNYFRHKWGWRESALCDCGQEIQTMEHIVRRCPLHSYPGPPEDLHRLTPDLISWLGTLNVDL